MSTFLFMILTGVAWMGLLGNVGWLSFVTGAGLGALIARIEGVVARKRFSPGRALRTLGLGAQLLASFFFELVVANFEQLRIVLAPRMDVHPGWIRFRTELETPPMRALLGLLLTLTPGSLTYDEHEDPDGGWAIGLHALDVRQEAEIVRRIRSRLEAPLRRIEVL